MHSYLIVSCTQDCTPPLVFLSDLKPCIQLQLAVCKLELYAGPRGMTQLNSYASEFPLISKIKYASASSVGSQTCSMQATESWAGPGNEAIQFQLVQIGFSDRHCILEGTVPVEVMCLWEQTQTVMLDRILNIINYIPHNEKQKNWLMHKYIIVWIIEGGIIA